MSVVISWTLLPEMYSFMSHMLSPRAPWFLSRTVLTKVTLKKCMQVLHSAFRQSLPGILVRQQTVPVMFWSKDGTAGSEDFHVSGLGSSKRTEKLPFCQAAGDAKSSSSDQLYPIFRVCRLLWLKPSYLQWSTNISNQELSPLSWSVCCHFSLSALRFRHINNNVS